MRLVDENGENLGEKDLYEALALARERELDLVEVAPKAQPPVCKIADYGKLKYQQARQEKQAKQKQKKVDIKGIRISLRTDTHDLDFKKEQAEKFLKKGHKVKIEIILKGRERTHPDLGVESLKKFTKSISFPFTIEQEVKRFPTGFNIIITP